MKKGKLQAESGRIRWEWSYNSDILICQSSVVVSIGLLVGYWIFFRKIRINLIILFFVLLYSLLLVLYLLIRFSFCFYYWLGRFLLLISGFEIFITGRGENIEYDSKKKYSFIQIKSIKINNKNFMYGFSQIGLFSFIDLRWNSNLDTLFFSTIYR